MVFVEALRDALEQVPTVRLAVLFGPTATGSAHQRSDLDIGVSLTPHHDDLSTLRTVLERTVRRTIDLIELDAAPPLLRFQIARHGVVLLARDPHVCGKPAPESRPSDVPGSGCAGGRRVSGRG